MATKNRIVFSAAIVLVSLLLASSAQSASVTLLFEGTTLPSSNSFVAGDPFSVELTYETSAPKSYSVGADDSGSCYQNAVVNLVFNYNHGAYVGTTAYADLMIFHGPVYSGEQPVDLFWVTGINGEGFPAIGSRVFSRINSAFGVEAPFGAAFADSSLPSSLSSPTFLSRRFELVWVPSSSETGAEFYGFIDSVTTVPEPSTISILSITCGLVVIARKRTRFSKL